MHVYKWGLQRKLPVLERVLSARSLPPRLKAYVEGRVEDNK